MQNNSPLHIFVRWAAIFVFLILSSVVDAQGPPPAAVVIAEAQERELAPTAWYTGSVVSLNDAKVPAEVKGRLTFVADIGKRAKKGDPVARMDDTLTRLELAEFKAEVERVSARLKFLVQEVGRLQRLAKQNATARNLLEETESERDRSRSELAVTQARMDQAKVRLERSVVRAPFSGVVSERIARTGEWVDSGDAVVRVVDPDALEIEANVSLHVVTNIAPGYELRVEAGLISKVARVRTIVPVGDALSRLVDVRLDFDNSSWSHGQVVRVSVPTALARKVVAVPRDALVLRRTGATVYRIGDDTVAERVAVITGVASGAWIEVQGEIVPGDRVIVRGGERMRPGQKVSIIKTMDLP